MTKEEFLSVENLFMESKNLAKIEQMTAYMKGRFRFLGISAPERKKLMKSIFSGFQWNHENVIAFANFAWDSKYRELQHAGLDVLTKNVARLSIDDMPFLEQLLLKKSWWDTVDALSVHPIGKTLRKDDSSEKKKWILKWADSEELWLRRAAILHQLKYKDKVDVALMEHTLIKATGTKEFFLNKAVGWMLREYSRTDPGFVVNFCSSHDLSPLSRKEALRLM